MAAASPGAIDPFAPEACRWIEASIRRWDTEVGAYCPSSEKIEICQQQLPCMQGGSSVVQHGFHPTWRLRVLKWYMELRSIKHHWDIAEDTMELALFYLDRYVSQRPVTHIRYKLAAMAAMLVASKFNDNQSRRIRVLHLANIWSKASSGSQEAFLHDLSMLEVDLLKSQRFTLHIPTTNDFLASTMIILSSFLRNTTDIKDMQWLPVLCKKYLVVLQEDYEAIAFPPQEKTATSIFCSLSWTWWRTSGMHRKSGLSAETLDTWQHQLQFASEHDTESIASVLLAFCRKLCELGMKPSRRCQIRLLKQIKGKALREYVPEAAIMRSTSPVDVAAGTDMFDAYEDSDMDEVTTPVRASSNSGPSSSSSSSSFSWASSSSQTRAPTLDFSSPKPNGQVRSCSRSSFSSSSSASISENGSSHPVALLVAAPSTVTKRKRDALESSDLSALSFEAKAKLATRRSSRLAELSALDH